MTDNNDDKHEKTSETADATTTVVPWTLCLAVVAAVVAALTVHLGLGAPGIPSGRCEDLDAGCLGWAAEGECQRNAPYMSAFCALSCGLCKGGEASVATGNAWTAAEASAARGLEEFKEVFESAAQDEAETVEEEEEDPAAADDDDDDGDDNDDDDDMQGRYEDEEEYEEEYEDEDDEQAEVDEDEADNSICGDVHEDCGELQEDGKCESDKEWMQENCRRTCLLCPTCSDGHTSCSFWAAHGECDANPAYMLQHCSKSCKVCDGPDNDDDVAGPKCKDKEKPMLCARRKAQGECERNPGWMIVFCARTCGKCDLLSQTARCTPEVFNDTSYVYENAIQKGDVTKIFQKIINEYPNVEVLSEPPNGPWVIKLPRFVSDLERETLLRYTLPYVKRSTDQGEFDEEGIQEQVVSTGRTSSNAWCTHECAQDPIVANLTNRISNLTTIPVKNFESYQVLQYKLTQKYDTHHDSTDEEPLDLAGPRIFTFFIYLSDVEEGGETWFDKLNIKVKPEKGMAILWPSVLDEAPNKVDWRTSHAALPVIKGEKLAANIWMHLRDFETPNLWGCTGSFD